MHILIVDDDAKQRIVLRHILEQEQHTIIEAGTTRDAKDALEGHKFHLVLLDIGLESQFAGLEVRRVVPRDTHIFVLSGMDKATVEVEARVNLLDGVELWIDKPIDVQTLLRAVRALSG